MADCKAEAVAAIPVAEDLCKHALRGGKYLKGARIKLSIRRYIDVSQVKLASAGKEDSVMFSRTLASC